MNQLIKGTSIEILTDTGAETVNNVLIGEPSETEMLGRKIPTYVLGIPKSDEHDWLDKKLRFFGMIFRTVGYPEQGIEANIPLAWHKRVKTELLCTTGNCIVFEKDTFTKHVFKDVYFYDSRGEKTANHSTKLVDNVTAYIYGCCNAGDYRPKAGDILVSGDSSFVFDVSSEQSASESMAEFRKLYPEFSVIKTVNHKVYGIRPDYEVTAV